jgi:hypothetical protein
MHTIKGFKIATSEQARTLLLVLMLKGDQEGAADAHWALKCLEEQGK